MVHRFQRGGPWGWALVGIMLTGIAAPARGDELQYLPKGAWLVWSIDVAAYLQSQLRREVKRQHPQVAEMFETREQTGLPLANLARLTAGVGPAPDDFAVVMTTIRPVTAAGIKAAVKPAPFQKDFAFKEVKVGAYTLYQESFRLVFDNRPAKDPAAPLEYGQAFCVVEDRVVLRGGLATLKEILERSPKAALAPGVEAGLKQTGLGSALTLVVDCKAIPAPEKQMLLKLLAPHAPGAADVLGKLHTSTFTANAASDIAASATLRCTDAASAAEAKKIAAALLAAFKDQAKDNPSLPAKTRDMLKEVRTLLDAVKLSTKDAEVHAEATVGAATVVQTIRSLFEPAVKNSASGKDAK